MSKQNLCEACASGPAQLEGHPHLFMGPSASDNPQLTFKCTRCGAAWKRQYVGDGRFDWVLHDLGGISSRSGESQSSG